MDRNATATIIEGHLAMWTKGKHPPSQVGRRVAALLHEWQGLHNLSGRLMRDADWSNERYVELRVDRWPDLSTYDGDRLTQLVFLAHDHAIRVTIQAYDRQKLSLIFFPRFRTGDQSERHATLASAVKVFTDLHPGEVPIPRRPEPVKPKPDGERTL